MDFNLRNFIIITTITIVSFYWIRKIHPIEKRTYYLFIVLFFYLICGVTGYLFNTKYYVQYYSIYTIILGLTFYITRNVTIKLSFLKKKTFRSFALDNSSNFIKIFLLIQFLSLLYPENKLSNLFVLSSPDVQTALDKSLDHSIWDSVIYLSSIFFYIGLSKYIQHPKKIIGLLILSSWLSYAGNSYLSRGAILRVLVVIFLLYYFKYPQKRKILIFSASICSIFLVSFFVSYMYMRMGNGFEMIDLSLAIDKIIEIELSFSKTFDDVLRYNNDDTLIYIWWFFSLPLPGFMKFGTADIAINEAYNRDILGVEAGDENFFITLPGLVIEGVYICGSEFFFIHAILFAIVCNLIFNIFRESKLFYVLSIYYIINIPFGAIRAGTQGLYPYTNKLIPIAILIIYLWYKIKLRYDKE